MVNYNSRSEGEVEGREGWQKETVVVMERKSDLCCKDSVAIININEAS
jgi:hypothetical protein